MSFVAAGTTSGKTLPWLLQATEENPWIGFWAFILTVALTMLVFHLGFARKLPLLKRLIVYTMLVLGSFFLWFMEFIFGAPIIAVLAISAVVLGIYRFRLHLHRKGDEKKKND